MPKVRRPTQAGSFYEADAQSLKRQIEECFLSDLGPGCIPEVRKNGPRRIVGLVCPHAGYVYSGPIAAHAYNELALDGKPDVSVILGPNHADYGSPLAVMNEGVWRTPLGDLEVDSETANQIVREASIVDVDESAHRYEHSIEVQLPFLQFLYGSSVRIVPICFRFMMQDLASTSELGEALARTLAGKNAVIIASSDMTHYEPHDFAKEKDMAALNAVIEMDEAKFYSTIEAKRVSACGFGPIMTLISAAKSLGVKEVKLLRYGTSGDVTGDYSSVVGYASVCFKK